MLVLDLVSKKLLIEMLLVRLLIILNETQSVAIKKIKLEHKEKRNSACAFKLDFDFEFFALFIELDVFKMNIVIFRNFFKV